MVTLGEYVARLPLPYLARYPDEQWVMWANGLLDRLSGAGILPPQTVTERAAVFDGNRIAMPQEARDVREVRNIVTKEKYRWHIRDGEIVLSDVVFNSGGAGDVGDEGDGEEERDDINDESDEDDEPIDARVEIIYLAAFEPVENIDDEIKIGRKYENLADAWFMWKAYEQIASGTAECVYWNRQVEEEMRRLRGENANRINKAKGRFLAGFSLFVFAACAV